PDLRSSVIATLLWGDEVTVSGKAAGWFQLDLGGGRVGWVKGRPPTRRRPLMKVSFIDVGQGDAAMVETTDGSRILIDGGEEKFLARYLAARFADTGAVHFDAIVITHGDADHFRGIPILVDAAGRTDRKKIVATADRVFHNGLVKRAGGSGAK